LSIRSAIRRAATALRGAVGALARFCFSVASDAAPWAVSPLDERVTDLVEFGPTPASY